MTPYVSDGLGRRTSIFIGAMVLCIATAIQTWANSLGMFIAARYASKFIAATVLAKSSDLYFQFLDWIRSSFLYHRCSLVDR
jgi:MFS family permease